MADGRKILVDESEATFMTRQYSMNPGAVVVIRATRRLPFAKAVYGQPANQYL